MEKERETINEEGTSLGTAVLQQAAQADSPDVQESITAAQGKKMTLKHIFLGDFLITDFLRRQALLLALVTVYTVIYISNRYSCQQEMIEIDRLHKQLTDIKYDALTRSSELTERTRQSHIEEYVSRENSELQISTNPPFVVKE